MSVLPYNEFAEILRRDWRAEALESRSQRGERKTVTGGEAGTWEVKIIQETLQREKWQSSEGDFTKAVKVQEKTGQPTSPLKFV